MKQDNGKKTFSTIEMLRKIFIFVVIALLFIVVIYQVDFLSLKKLTIVEKEETAEGMYEEQKRSEKQVKKINKNNTKCYKNIFKNTLIVMNFNYAFYGNNKILHELYDNVFGKILTCGPAPDDSASQGPDILYKEEKIWYFRYRCLTKAIRKYPGYDGYIYSNDDLIVNWWNLLKLDRKKVWQSGIVDWRQKAYGKIVNNAWMWWTYDMGLKACQKYYEELKRLAESNPKEYKKYLDTYLANSKGEPRCAKGWSDMFYVPGRFAQGYAKLSDIAYKNKLFLEIAGNNLIRTLDKLENFEYLNGTYLPDLFVGDHSADGFKKVYNKRMTFLHPVKLNSKTDKDQIQTIIRNEIVSYKKSLTEC